MWDKDIAVKVKEVWTFDSTTNGQDRNFVLWEYETGNRELGYPIRNSKRGSWKFFCENIQDISRAKLTKILARLDQIT